MNELNHVEFMSCDPEKIEPRLLLAKCKSEGQRAVLKSLIHMEMAIEKYGLAVGDIKLRRSALIYGMSGAGKSWLAELFSNYLVMPHYSTTVGSWSLKANRDGIGTIKKILKLIREKGPICIVIDECDKFSGKSSEGNSAYFRSVLDEIMSLAMASLDEFTPSQETINRLGKSWLVFCGTWQDIYKTLDTTEHRRISPEMLIEHSNLPDELINRTGLLLELAPPDIIELMVAMKQIESSIGLFISDDERKKHATDFVNSRKGFRGVQDYALTLAMRGVLEKTSRAEKSGRFPKLEILQKRQAA